MPTTIRLATRTSPLALWQARHTAALLRARHPGIRIRIVGVESGGDQNLQTPLHKMPTVGVFCKEVQAAVMAGKADCGVHSLKDLPTSEPEGMVLAACLRRADPRDAMVGATLETLPQGAVVGTSSLRRRGQLKHLRPDLSFVDLRGNVATRLQKIENGVADATILACAGLGRLGIMRQVNAIPLHPVKVLTPAPGQGVVGIDCRHDDLATRRILLGIDDHPSRLAATCERQLLAALEGGCSLPLGAHAYRLPGGLWRLDARLGGGDEMLRECHFTGPLHGLWQKAYNALR